MKIARKKQAAWTSVVYSYNWPMYVLNEFILGEAYMCIYRRSLSTEKYLGDICSVLW